jgi:hypothetical protein
MFLGYILLYMVLCMMESSDVVHDDTRCEAGLADHRVLSIRTIPSQMEQASGNSCRDVARDGR